MAPREGDPISLTDQSTRIHASEEPDATVINPYLKTYIPGLKSTPRVSQFPDGTSNLIYLIRYPCQGLVLHRPPFGHKAKSAHGMSRRYHILNQLSAGFSYCPKTYLYCTDESVISAEFYIVERVKGIILCAELPPELNLDKQQTRSLCKSFIDKFVELHNVSYAAYGLADLGRPDGYVQRQIAGWTDRYEETLTPDALFWEPVKAWLKDKRPADHHKPGIAHDGYRFDNVILDPDNPMRIIGILDWESATLGNPPVDFDNTLAYWVEAGDPTPIQLTRRQPNHLPGMLTRQELANYCAERAGIPPTDDLDFYYIYDLFRLTDIIQQIYYRYYHGQTQDKRFTQLMQMNKLLKQMSPQTIEHSRL